MTPEKIPEKSESRIKRTPKSFCKISCDVWLEPSRKTYYMGKKAHVKKHSTKYNFAACFQKEQFAFFSASSRFFLTL